MHLVKLIPPNADDNCNGERDCPGVYDDLDSDEYAVIQGYLMSDLPPGIPDGEGMLRYPKAQLRALAVQLAQL